MISQQVDTDDQNSPQKKETVSLAPETKAHAPWRTSVRGPASRQLKQRATPWTLPERDLDFFRWEK